MSAFGLLPLSAETIKIRSLRSPFFKRIQKQKRAFVFARFEKSTDFVCVSGAGGNRTRVQTRKVSAFYKLILQLVFDRGTDAGAQPSGLFPLFNSDAGTSLERSYHCPRLEKKRR